MSLIRRRLLEKLMQKKDELPDGYIKLEYIEGTGTQWIDTGTLIGNKYGVEIKFYCNNTETGFLFGARKSAQGNAYNLIFSGTGLLVDCDKRVSVNRKINNIQVFKKVGRFNYMDGVESIPNEEISDFVTPVSAYLFSTNTMGKSETIAKAKVYYCKITDDNRNIIRNLLPCINPNGVVGMFDTIEDKFYANKGSGKFIPGYHLPDGYTILEYIESTGTQYIDTGVIPKSTDCISINCIISEDRFNKVMFGSRTSGNYMTSKNQIYLNENSSQFSMFFGTNTMNLHGLFDTSTSRVINGLFDVKNKKIANRNNANFIGASSDFDNTATQPYYLFALNNCGKAGVFTTMKLFSFAIWDDDKKVRDFIPCKTNQGVVGLYDIISSKFYGNMGTGQFLAPS